MIIVQQMKNTCRQEEMVGAPQEIWEEESLVQSTVHTNFQTFQSHYC